jgi:hypothetical protein
VAKISVKPTPFKDIKQGEEFVCLKTFSYALNFFVKIAPKPQSKRWLLPSNAIMNGQREVYFSDKIMCVLLSEFEKRGIKLK